MSKEYKTAEDEVVVQDDIKTGEPADFAEPDENDNNDDAEDAGGYDVLSKECRIHPPVPVNLFRGAGNKTEIVTSQTLLGNKPVYIYEFPTCVGEDCEAYWCNEHQICSFACRHEAECHGTPPEKE